MLPKKGCITTHFRVHIFQEFRSLTLFTDMFDFCCKKNLQTFLLMVYFHGKRDYEYYALCLLAREAAKVVFSIVDWVLSLLRPKVPPNPYLTGNFAPVEDASRFRENVKVEGRIPDGLSGQFVRNGKGSTLLMLASFFFLFFFFFCDLRETPTFHKCRTKSRNRPNPGVLSLVRAFSIQSWQQLFLISTLNICVGLMGTECW
jgi:hypothetical protein